MPDGLALSSSIDTALRGSEEDRSCLGVEVFERLLLNLEVRRSWVPCMSTWIWLHWLASRGIPLLGEAGSIFASPW
eukprot:scaffold553698_cov47-Prasinocladus_malaysianus.AAC.1